MATKTETQVNELKINVLSEADYNTALTNGEINENEIYMTPDSGTGGSAEYIKSLSVSGRNITYTKGDGSTGVITTQDTVYTHPTTAGYKHIPSGGSSGQILRWSSDGTATWGADNNTTYSAGTGLSLSGTTFSNSGVRSISTGSANGTISVNTGGTSANVSVKGLGSAAYTDSSNYATASHTHKYAGSSSAGGSATSAVKLDTSAGSASTPVYFSSGKPTACTSVSSSLIKIGTTSLDDTINSKMTYPTYSNAQTLTWNGTNSYTATANCFIICLDAKSKQENYGCELTVGNVMIMHHSSASHTQSVFFPLKKGQKISCNSYFSGSIKIFS